MRDRAAYEVASEILAGGPSSRLKADAGGGRNSGRRRCAPTLTPTRDPGLHAIWVQMTEGAHPPSRPNA